MQVVDGGIQFGRPIRCGLDGDRDDGDTETAHRAFDLLGGCHRTKAFRMSRTTTATATVPGQRGAARVVSRRTRSPHELLSMTPMTPHSRLGLGHDQARSGGHRAASGVGGLPLDLLRGGMPITGRHRSGVDHRQRHAGSVVVPARRSCCSPGVNGRSAIEHSPSLQACAVTGRSRTRPTPVNCNGAVRRSAER